MRYNFKRVDGASWIDLVRSLRLRGLAFLECKKGEIYDRLFTHNVFTVYYYKTITFCKLVYYNFYGGRWHKVLRQINFSDKEIDPVRCVLTFKRITKKHNESIGYEPDKVYTNGVYLYFNKKYKGKATALDMNAAYLYALTQPLADWTTQTECTPVDVFRKTFDYYSFENGLKCEMFYKDDMIKMQGAMLIAGVKIYGYKGKIFFPETAKELYSLRKKNPYYKNVANIAIGCMHKHSGVQNNTTIAASLYAWFAWMIRDKVDKFSQKGYNVIMVSTDSIKIEGEYNEADDIVEIGEELGQYKYEYVGDAEYYSEGHYKQKDIKWKGRPQYLIEGYKPCTFLDNLEEEKEVYIKYAKL